MTTATLLRGACLALAVPLLAPLAAAQSTPPTSSVPTSGTPPGQGGDERGFSYFLGLGRHSVTYEERPSIVPAVSRAKASSPLLITGALYAVDAHNLLSLDSEATFAPGTTTERWTATASSIAGTPLTSSLLQTNRFSLQQTTTRLLWHYRLRDAFFVMGGPSFHSSSFKRFGFAAGPDNAVALPAGTIEETVSEALLNVGVSLESERVRQVGHHYGLRASLGLPMWRRVQNTGFPNQSFDGTAGWDLSLAGRYSIALRPNIHLGAWGQWVHSERAREVRGSIELPRSEAQSMSYGVELLWKL
jgi:hypothetical protein